MTALADPGAIRAGVAPAGRIGPNAVTQLTGVLSDRCGAVLTGDILDAAGGRAWLTDPPAAMLDEDAAAALHRAVRQLRPDATGLLAEAGRRTGAYILAHRIPAPARVLLPLLPRRLATRLLLRAIAAHAWTFAGSGRVTVDPGPPARLTLHDNPLIRGEHASAPLCHWHRAVLEHLFRALTHPATRVVETACTACGDPACRFDIRPGP